MPPLPAHLPLTKGEKASGSDPYTAANSNQEFNDTDFPFAVRDVIFQLQKK